MVLPGLEALGWHFGGFVSVFNSLIFILAVFMFIADGRPFLALRNQKGNRWSSVVVGSAALALFFMLLFGLPLLARWDHALAVAEENFGPIAAISIPTPADRFEINEPRLRAELLAAAAQARTMLSA